VGRVALPPDLRAQKYSVTLTVENNQQEQSKRKTHESTQNTTYFY
jgi:PKD repeat protein